MNRSRKLLSAIVLSAVFFTASSCGGDIGVGAGQALALAAALEAVKPGIDESVNNAGNQADQAMRNAQTRADYLIKRLHEEATTIGGGIATQREQTAGQAFTLLGQIYSDTQQARLNFSISTFQGLAAAAGIVDSIPFAHVHDTPFAALPIALKGNAPDRRITIYGYFPSLRSGVATVTFDNGVKIKATRGIGSLYFEVPDDLVKNEGSFVNASISLPRRSLFASPDSFGTRIFVLPQKPFHVTLEFFQSNVSAYRDVAGASQPVRADSDHQSVHWIQNVGTLFLSSVSSHSDYDPTDVVFKDVQLVQTGNDKPCGCCPSPSYELHSKTLDQVDIELNAPSCGRCGSLFNMCGGGGSHIDYSATPIFTARLTGTPKLIPLSKQKFDMAENDTHEVPLDPKALITHVTIEVSDGQSTAKDFAEVSSGSVNQSAPQAVALAAAAVAAAAGRRTWDVDVVSGNTIVISTRNLPVNFVGQ